MAHLKKKDGLWVLHNDKDFCMGLTKEIQDELGEVSFVSFPKIGQTVKAGEPFLEVEAEKAVSEFKSPVTGVVASINEKAEKDPAALNTEDELDAWVLSFRQVDVEEFETL
ncbi:glycine cleavage system protein H [Enterococcus sp. 669A]|uniref:Glycine cleavage system protein H n=1 Tax=Candidatus Enterococcus moelleringii TaxID=2815325 RepID=A0ABS3L5M8_9ENTE|nr:glycine cleavage system protein H [Enterococcus sp. 669A]MBO1304918.1 glycine cleavage system protein H [Enterococcus sp. 669A]